jgi:hypothetical protein
MVSEHFGNPLGVSDSNKLGNREKFSKLKKPFQAFPSLENFFRFPSLLLSETPRGFPKCSETFFLPSKTIFGFPKSTNGFPNVRELILAGIREYLFFRVYSTMYVSTLYLSLILILLTITLIYCYLNKLA